MLIDASDKYKKWYVAFVKEKNLSSVNVHFLQLNERFDEWFELESSDTFKRLRPLGSTGLAEGPQDYVIKCALMHRRVNLKEDN